ncbi:MAG: hypothetical protein SPL96_01420 [Bacteroidales bacterium]|nr:hypothetical protein [Bacteroidales bacterium]
MLTFKDLLFSVLKPQVKAPVRVEKWKKRNKRHAVDIDSAILPQRAA